MIRILSSLLLALVLGLTSQSMAVARGASAASGTMVLCTGSGPMVVYIDVEGQPTGAPHICPDAAMHVPVDPVTPYIFASSGKIETIKYAVVSLRVQPVQPRFGPPQRAPPFSV